MEERRSREKIIDYEVYTDGSLKKLGQSMTFGGWAFIVTQNGQELYRTVGNEYGTTSQRMELIAVLKALEYTSSIRRPNERVCIYSDSAYVINCYVQQWYITWQQNGWCNAAKQPVANQDLWYQLIPYFDNFWYSFEKVKGHANVFYNEACDKLAQEEAQSLKINWRGTNG